MAETPPAPDMAAVLAALAELPAKLASAVTVPQLLSADEAATYSGISRAGLYRLAAEKKLRQVTVPGSYPKFRKSDLDRWISSLKAK